MNGLQSILYYQMKVSVFVLLVAISFFSCKTQPKSSRENDAYDPNKMYKLQLNPPVGSSYYYDITNESEMEVEIDDKKTGNETKTTTGLSFKIDKDSTGGFSFTMQYDKLKYYSKTGDREVNVDAANATGSFDPIEKTLGAVKNTSMVAMISPSGEVKSINGYKELGDKIIAGFAPGDETGKATARLQWEKQVGSGMIKNNMRQLFKIFPDSMVHLRDTWRLTSEQEGEVSLMVKSTFTLKAINNDIAIISVTGNITSDAEGSENVQMTTALKGEQEGEFQMETKTGMLISCNMKATMNGTINVMGREVPVMIKTRLKMNGRRL
jgi:hypothetical protein